MKRLIPGFLVSSLALVGSAQTMEKVYNRDTHDSFHLKSHHTDSIVKGPMVKQKTLFTYDNPFTKLTEASYWFSIPNPGVLSGFGYYYKDEFVPGILMDKDKAWFIYTAITSRNEDPGIMTQLDSQSYHAQIYPLAVGYPLRVELNTVNFLELTSQGLAVPVPDVEELEGEKGNFSSTVVVAQPQTVRQVVIGGVKRDVVSNPSTDPVWMQYYAQKHKDGKTYVVGMVRTNRPNDPYRIRGLDHILWERPENGPQDGSVKLFMGTRRGAGKIEVVSDAYNRKEVLKGVIHANEKGTDTAKLWAHAKLKTMAYNDKNSILRFSMKYQIPSSQTALLAVPAEEMKLFKAKEAEFRRKQQEEARKQREWQKKQRMNWNNSGGGDPEIRIEMPGAIKVKAILPDGREFDLKRDAKGFWGGNFDIPATASEGDYEVKIVGVKADGSLVEETIHYTVDRTAPTGDVVSDKGFYKLKASENLARAVAVFGSGEEVNMVPMEDGTYQLPSTKGRLIKVMLIDQAHNIGEAKCSP